MTYARENHKSPKGGVSWLQPYSSHFSIHKGFYHLPFMCTSRAYILTALFRVQYFSLGSQAGFQRAKLCRDGPSAQEPFLLSTMICEIVSLWRGQHWYEREEVEMLRKTSFAFFIGPRRKWRPTPGWRVRIVCCQSVSGDRRVALIPAEPYNLSLGSLAQSTWRQSEATNVSYPEKQLPECHLETSFCEGCPHWLYVCKSCTFPPACPKVATGIAALLYL